MDSNDFGRVQYQIRQSSVLSVDQDTGTIRLVQFDPSTDPKFVEVTVDAIDNLGVEPSLMSSAVVKV